MMNQTQIAFSRRDITIWCRRRFHWEKRRHGFTLVELLIVIAIITILAAMLLPAISRSKARAQAIMCMNNSKHLALAWTMYSTDNNDRLAYNQGGDPTTRTFAPPQSPNWVNNIMDWELSTDDTNVNFVGISILAPYAGFSAGIYHCPSDHALSGVQKSAGWTSRVRSVSMNAMVGDPGSLLHAGVNASNPTLEQFLYESDIRDPSSIFVFLDEHPDSINDGSFLNTPGLLEWTDLPASYHNGGGSFSFADGHTEIHRWHCPSTLRSPQPNAAALPISLRSDELSDFGWVIQHTSLTQN
jgi:prepilin-type N-terminal cleavage/methylation domain-containing protein/prepilin-type processing-associated H-X9-DG protein